MQNMSNSLSEEAHETDHSSANDPEGDQARKVNQASQDAFTNEITTSGIGAAQIDQFVSRNNNAKNTTSKPTSSKPQKLESPMRRNFSEFSTTQRQCPSARMASNNSDPSTTTTSSREFQMPTTKTTNQGHHRSGTSSRSDSLESTSSSTHIKPHTGGDVRWDAINMVSKGSSLNHSHFRLVKLVGYGDIGSVYLVELKGTGAFFAMKVMDKASLASRNKLLRAQTEREILGLLDHPFVPTLYSYFETDKHYCLVMEFCSCGSLHSLRLKQPNRHFTEEAARLVT